MRDVDNSTKIMSFIDAKSDNDTFWYTELLDRATNGSSRFKLLRTFEHNDQAHFLEQWPTIKMLCDRNNVRAYTRLSPRSRKRVGKAMLERLFKAVVMDEQYGQVGRAYASVCGKHPIRNRLLWLYDIDGEVTYGQMGRLEGMLKQRDVYKVAIQTKSGFHLICKPHKIDYVVPFEAQLHKDNPTVLYAPESAV